MSKKAYSEVLDKDGTAYLIQEMYDGPKKYFCMTRKANRVLDCEKDAVQEMPVNDL